MSLLGLLATIFTCGNLISDSSKEYSFNKQSKQDAINNGDIKWMDWHGDYRLVSTGEKVFKSNNKLRSVKTGEVIVDYALEKRNNAIKNARENGKKYVVIKYPEYKDRCYYTELSTMKRYYLEAYYSIKEKRHIFTKSYYTDGKPNISTKFDNFVDKEMEITEQEYRELGGYYSKIDSVCNSAEYGKYLY